MNHLQRQNSSKEELLQGYRAQREARQRQRKQQQLKQRLLIGATLLLCLLLLFFIAGLAISEQARVWAKHRTGKPACRNR